MNKRIFLVILLCLVAIATVATDTFCKMNPFMEQVQSAQPTWIPIVNGRIHLARGWIFNFSIWRDAGGGLQVVIENRIPDDSHPAIFRLTGSNGKNWTIMDTKLSDAWVTILATSVYVRDFAEGLGSKPDGLFVQEHQAANAVMRKLESLGKVTDRD